MTCNLRCYLHDLHMLSNPGTQYMLKNTQSGNKRNLPFDAKKQILNILDLDLRFQGHITNLNILYILLIIDNQCTCSKCQKLKEEFTFQAVDRFEVVTLTVDSKVISENWNLLRNLHTKSNQCAIVCLFCLI